MTRNTILITLAGAFMALVGCGGKNGFVGGGQGNSVFLKSISMTPANPTMTLAVSPQAPATQPFVVIGQYNVGNPKDITGQMTWLTADPKVATLDSNGIATATGSGKVIITSQIFEPATQKTLQATTVLSVVPQLTSITVSPASAQIARETAQQFTATGGYNDGTHADITSLASWNSSQPAASVSSSPGTQGRALGISAGSAGITASMGSLTSTAALLTVTNANLVTIAVSPSNSSVSLANSRQFAATGTFDDGTKQDISVTTIWTSSNPEIARVTSTGLITGLGVGTTNITARLGAVTDSTTATVDAHLVSKMNVIPADKIAANTNSQMRAVAVLTDGSSMEVTSTPGIAWSSSNNAVAMVDAGSGLADAKAPGSSTISAKLGTQTGSAPLNVADATIQSLAVAPNQATIAPGTSQNIVALATFSDNEGQFQQDISSAAAWSSDNTTVAILSYAKGLQERVSGIAAGTANIGASFSDAHGNMAGSSAALNVSSATLTGIGVAPGNAGVTFGGGHQFIATGSFSDGTQQDLTLLADWSAVSPAIATVNPFGFAAASGPGQTSIEAALNAQIGSSSILVNPGALVRIDICPADTADPLSNCPPLDPFAPPPPISFAKVVPYSLIAIGTFSDGSREDLTSSVRWTSSSPSLATVSNDPGIPGYVTGVTTQGVVTGLAAGHVTVTTTSGTVQGSSDVIVTEATPTLLTITPMNGTVQQGLTRQLAVVATFTDNSTETVTSYVRWTTSDPSIAIVYPGGVAFPTSPGVATVTAHLGGSAGSTTLTVQ